MSDLIETEIGTIAPDWKVCTLEEVCEPPQYGYTASAGARGNAQFLRITDITESGVNWSTVPFCECPKKSLSKYLLASGDIVFARIGATTGKSYLISDPPPSVFASYLIRVRPKSEIDPAFLSYFFRTQGYWQQIDAQKDTNLKKGVNGSLLKKLIVPVPPLPEQKKIAHILTTVQRAIEEQDRIIQTTTELKKALMQRLFTEGLRGEPQKETEIGLVPESWEVVKIGDLGLDIGDGNYSTKYPRQDQFTSQGVPFLRAVNLKDGRIVWDDMRFISAELHSELRKGHVQQHDVILVTRGNIGEVAFATDEFVDANMNAQLVRLNGHEHLDGRFLYFVFLHEERQKQFSALSTGTALRQLPIGKLKTILLPIPQKDEQQRIGEILVMLENKEGHGQRKKSIFQELFRTLLHELMTASIRVNDLEFSVPDNVA